MTNPSEEEARAEAHARHERGELYVLTKSRITTFVEGAMWAASRLSTPLSEDVRTADNIEPGLWLDSWGNVWRMWRDGIFSMPGTPDQDPKQYEPFTRIVPAPVPAVPVLPDEDPTRRMTVTDLPRVMRSPLITTDALFVSPEFAPDGLLRIFVPEAVSDEQIAHLTEALIEAEDRAQRLDRAIQSIRALLAPSDPKEEQNG